MIERLSIRDFADLTVAQIAAARELEISDKQVEFGGTFVDSVDLISSAQSNNVQGYGFLISEQIIGLVILKRPPLSPDWVSNDAVSLHGLKIDRCWQGKGLGTEAFNLTARQAISRWPDTRELVLSVDADNTAALAIYRGFGMIDSGPVYDGRIGKEHRLSISISKFPKLDLH